VFDLSDAAQRQLVSAGPAAIDRAAKPLLLDEWQRLPLVWDHVRHQVDRDATGGQFLLAGSAAPARDIPIHSGAGRIVRLIMRPLAFCERGLAETTVSFGELLAGYKAPMGGESPIDLAVYADEITRSGFPGIRHLPDRARRLQLDSYITRALEHDMEENGTDVRRPEALRSWLSAYAAATATTASYSKILGAATPGETDKPVRQTVAGYREALERQFLLDPIPGWVPALTPLNRLSQSPKHFLVDPALAARLIGVDAAALLGGHRTRAGAYEGPLLGALFESLAALTVRALAQSYDARVLQLRTRGGEHEVDFIVEGADRRVVALEVKLTATPAPADSRHLRWLKAQLGDRLADAAIITTGRYAYRQPDDGIAVIPLALLGA
jgi:predicted AAA+ superfamily ATPase